MASGLQKMKLGRKYPQINPQDMEDIIGRFASVLDSPFSPSLSLVTLLSCRTGLDGCKHDDEGDGIGRKTKRYHHQEVSTMWAAQVSQRASHVDGRDYLCRVSWNKAGRRELET
jgi:hypothetical protein